MVVASINSTHVGKLKRAPSHRVCVFIPGPSCHITIACNVSIDFLAIITMLNYIFGVECMARLQVQIFRIRLQG